MVNDTLCPNKEITLADGTTMTVLDTEKAPIGDDADKTMGAELFVRRKNSRYTEKTVTVLDENGNQLTDEDGNLVGMVNEVVDGGKEIYVTPINHILRFIDYAISIENVNEQ